MNLLNSVTKIFVITVKGLEPATSYVIDQNGTTVPARHMWETASLNQLQFMRQWFIRFPEFTEFLFYLGKTPTARSVTSCIILVTFVRIAYWTKNCFLSFAQKPIPSEKDTNLIPFHNLLWPKGTRFLRFSDWSHTVSAKKGSNVWFLTDFFGIDTT